MEAKDTEEQLGVVVVEMITLADIVQALESETNMETIKINDIVKKDSGLVIVKYSPMPNGTLIEDIHLKATMNTKWQAQDVDYIEKDVGIGGTVSVLIVPKGDYINITKVDMKSGVKGGVEGKFVPESPANVPQKTTDDTMMYSDKDRSIIAQCLTKVFCRNMQLIATEPKFVLDAYNYFLGEL